MTDERLLFWARVVAVFTLVCLIGGVVSTVVEGPSLSGQLTWIGAAGVAQFRVFFNVFRRGGPR